MKPTPEFLTEQEVAATIGGGATPRLLRYWREKRQGPPFVRLGKRVAYSRDGLEKFIEDLKAASQ